MQFNIDSIQQKHDEMDTGNDTLSQAVTVVEYKI